MNTLSTIIICISIVNIPLFAMETEPNLLIDYNETKCTYNTEKSLFIQIKPKSKKRLSELLSSNSSKPLTHDSFETTSIKDLVTLLQDPNIEYITNKTQKLYVIKTPKNDKLLPVIKRLENNEHLLAYHNTDRKTALKIYIESMHQEIAHKIQKKEKHVKKGLKYGYCGLSALVTSSLSIPLMVLIITPYFM